MRRKPTVSGPGRPSRAGGIASGTLFWCGAALIGILAIPTVILIGAILLIWKVTDVLLRRIEGRSSCGMKFFGKN